MKINPSELAFDIDGVVADTMTLFLDIAEKYYSIHNIRYEDITQYSLHGLAGMDELTMAGIIERILSGNFSGTLYPLEGAPAVLKKLNQRYGTILFVTARPDTLQAEEWMAHTLGLSPDAVEIIATGSFDDKQKVLLDRGIKYFVEDRLETCFMLNESGIAPIVFKQPWNRKPHPFREVENWYELESLITLE